MAVLKAEETRVVTIDGETRVVESLPDNAKRLVSFYDDWKQKELEARSSLLMAQTAMRALANEIVNAIHQAENPDDDVDVVDDSETPE